MMKILTLLLFLISFSSGFSQSKEISKIVSDSLDNVDLEIRLTRIATNSKFYKAGDLISISTRFEINSNGELINIGARASLPELEQLIISKLRNIMIPTDILEGVSLNYSELKFALPIRFQVKSESDIIKIIEKDKRRKEKEKRKAARKN